MSFTLGFGRVRESRHSSHLGRPALLALVLLAGVLVQACGNDASSPAPTLQPTASAPTPQPTAPAPTPQPTAAALPAAVLTQQVGGGVGDEAPEFQGIASWINSGPLTMSELRGKVVLVDFWTYTCVNCIRTFPYLREWHAKYASLGLSIVGVHTPEFDFEKVRENVVLNAEKHGLTYLIAQDNDFGTWRAYSNRFWPAKYLIDKDGVVRYSHFGEGAYDATEQVIRGLLEEAGANVSAIPAGADPGPAPDPRARAPDLEDRLTRELYAGYLRNAGGAPYVLHEEYYPEPEHVVVYQDPGDHRNHFIYLQGPWFNGLENLVHARQTDRFEDYIAVKFSATSVNAVVEPENGKPFEVLVTIDGRPLAPEEAGADLLVAGGRSYFVVTEARMYQVVQLPTYGSHELKLSAKSSGFGLFAFTFGGYPEGP